MYICVCEGVCWLLCMCACRHCVLSMQMGTVSVVQLPARPYCPSCSVFLPEFITSYFLDVLHADEEGDSLPRLPLLLESGPLNVFITSDQEEELEGGVLKAINERRQTAQEVGGELLPDELYRVRVCCCPLSSFQCWGSIMELRACKLRGDLTSAARGSRFFQ
jgi:hypothetical protein